MIYMYSSIVIGVLCEQRAFGIQQYGCSLPAHPDPTEMIEVVADRYPDQSSRWSKLDKTIGKP